MNLEDEQNKSSSFGYRRAHAHVYDYEMDFFSSMTTYHGLVRIYNAEHWLARLLWFMMVLVSFLLFLSQATSVLYSYHQKPTVTRINYEVNGTAKVFPVLTLCNFNPIKRSSITDPSGYNMSNPWDVRYASLANMMPETFYTNSLINKTEFQDLTESFTDYTDWYKNKYNKSFSFYNMFNDTGFTCEDMVKQCWFAGSLLPDCCNRSVEVMTDFGKCIQFQSLDSDKDGITHQLVTGAQYGFTVLLDAKTNEQHEAVEADYYDTGFKFLVHSDHHLPRLGINGHVLSPGQKFYGAITKQQLSLLGNKDWGLCIDDWKDLNISDKHNWKDNYSPILENDLNYAYTWENCETNCLLNMFTNLLDTDDCFSEIQQSTCIPQSYLFEAPSTLNYVECDPYTLFTCMQIISHFTSNYTGNGEGKPPSVLKTWIETCQCEVECHRVVYAMDGSYSTIPNAAAEKRLADKYNVTGRYIKKNYALLSVYLSEMFYEERTQQKQTNAENTLGTIGGMMGMFMGMSIVTMAEIFVFMMKSIWMTVHDLFYVLLDKLPPWLRKVLGRPAKSSGQPNPRETKRGSKPGTFNGSHKFTYDTDLNQYKIVHDQTDWTKLRRLLHNNEGLATPTNHRSSARFYDYSVNI